MKYLPAITALLSFAAFPLLVLGQEESPTPNDKLGLRATDSSAEMEPSVSVPSERTMKEYPRPGAAATPSPSPKKAPSTSPKPAKAESRTKASPTPAKKELPAPSRTTETAPKGAVGAVKEMENRWLAALQSHDAGVVQSLVSDDYIGVTATGKFVNKAALLAEMKKDKNTYDSAANTQMDVRMHGETAVIVGTTRQAGKDEAGKPFTYFYRWTDTWAQRNGDWVCVASQSVQVAK